MKICFADQNFLADSTLTVGMGTQLLYLLRVGLHHHSFNENLVENPKSRLQLMVSSILSNFRDLPQASISCVSHVTPWLQSVGDVLHAGPHINLSRMFFGKRILNQCQKVIH